MGKKKKDAGLKVSIFNPERIDYERLFRALSLVLSEKDLTDYFWSRDEAQNNDLCPTDHLSEYKPSSKT